MKFLLINNGFHYKNYNAISAYRCYELTEIEVDNEIETLEELENTYSFSLKDYDVIYSPSMAYDIKNHTQHKFIFGPHFSVFPEENDMKKISYPNAVYLQPSLWSVECWKKYPCTKNINFQIMPFGVDCKMYKNVRNINDRKKIFIYFKSRRQEELAFVTNYLTLNQIEYIIFYHGLEYEETDYLKFLQQDAKFGIWIGRHESQGFALEEAMAANVPLLVWDVVSMNQEVGQSYPNIQATCVPYWDARCGEKIDHVNDFCKMIEIFISKLALYEPRKYIIENVSMESCELKMKNFLRKFLQK
tara:strand:+ start:132 stop:1037 length:906 start_codon:yes stop_codon:yes gene_type:complete